jgi:hypothetical protein
MAKNRPEWDTEMRLNEAQVIAYSLEARAMGYAAVYGYGWGEAGKPGDNGLQFGGFTGATFENDILQMSFAGGALTVWSPRGIVLWRNQWERGRRLPQGSMTLVIGEARKLRWEETVAAPSLGRSPWHAEFWRMDGDFYGRCTNPPAGWSGDVIGPETPAFEAGFTGAPSAAVLGMES